MKKRRLVIIIIMIGVIFGLATYWVMGSRIEFEPILVSFEFVVEEEIIIHSQAFDIQGNPLAGEYLFDETLVNIAETMAITMPNLPVTEFSFELVLSNYNFTEVGFSFFELEQLLPVIADNHVQAVAGIIEFNNIIFASPGTFTFQVIQHDVAPDSNWSLSELDLTVSVKVYVDEQGELASQINYESSSRFLNTYFYDLSPTVQTRFYSRWQDHLTHACEMLNLEPIEAVLVNYGANLAIYFENLETGCTFIHNPEQNFFAASVTKAPFALWLYTKADADELDLDQYLVYQQQHWFDGSGVIRHQHHFGTQFTVRELIALNLYQSDNIATQMLRLAFGYRQYADFIASIGGTHDYARDIWNSRITAPEAGFFMRTIFEYIESGAAHSQELREHLLNNQFPFIVADYPVASKTGWFMGFTMVMHDIAIVYAPSPYTLSILSANRFVTPVDIEVFHAISRAFQEFNQINFINPWPEE